MAFVLITLLTTLRSTGSAHERRPCARNYIAVFLSVSMLLPARCDHTGASSSTLQTEIIWLTTSRRSHLLPQLPLRVGSDLITPVLVVRDLEIHTDGVTPTFL